MLRFTSFSHPPTGLGQRRSGALLTLVSRGVLAAGLVLTTWAAHALDMGPLQWIPASPKAPVADIQLIDVTPILPATIKARIASPDAYKVAGLTYNPGLSSIEIKTQATANGQVFLRLENFPRDILDLDLLVIVSSRHAFSLAEYRLDLRRGAHEIKPSPAGTTQAKTNLHRTADTKSSVPVAPENLSEEHGISESRLAILAWAQAWSRRDVPAYLGAYTPDYAGNDSSGKRPTWIELRRARILARKNISVELFALALIREGNLVTATFTQRYTSDGPTSHVRKQMRLVPVNGRWLIQSETALP